MYFISLIIFGQYIMVNLFLTILIKNFDETSLQWDIESSLNNKKKKTEKVKEILKKFYRFICS